jgi:hypothetical protein
MTTFWAHRQGSSSLKFRDSLAFYLDCLTIEYGIDRLFQNSRNYQSALHNISEEQRPHLYHGRRLKSCKLNRVGFEGYFVVECNV